MLLRWKQTDLANASGISQPSIRRLEAKGGPLSATSRTVRDLEATFRRHGVWFIDDGETIGVSKTID